MASIHVVDDESSICWAIEKLGTKLGHEVQVASTAEQGLELLTEKHPDLMFLDVRLPGMSGLEALPEIKRIAPETPVVLITAFGDLEVAVEAVRQGTFDYLVKPFSLEDIQTVIDRALAQKTNEEEIRPESVSAEMVGTSSAMQEVFKRIALAARSVAPIVIQGESGTGKELVAQAIHRYGPRHASPFVAVNIASLAPSLIESELFGHVRGAFTHAIQDKRGLLQQANGGTLFLDEVAEIPLPTQAKLLRALEQREVVPVGGSTGEKVDFRIVCASHQDLSACVKQGTFRHDLLFRLNTFRIELPPLRERRDDIPLLVYHFLEQLEKEYDKRLRISPAAMHELEQRSWYGNVRELRNAVEHAQILARHGVIEKENLPPPVAKDWFDRSSPAESPEENLVRSIGAWTKQQTASGATENLWSRFQALAEKEMLQELLAQCDGQYLAIARVLGIHRTTVKKKCEQYGLLSSEQQDD
ncbi:sigma-54-dependent Fis family transcriptional regulator [Bremerella cremea]|uniref:DNA-binding transcriptional regulator NtrC n=1 Tax=Bremerella cremea TaxID=1031537 RepID=A0A368KW51_9BACT|nr:sigma-54 dependent transcriptional regulator [Bremerella cremea]RCS51914.1 sigma-54-dependent Fis family transcriptional regulator [Bremerella cremea]